MSIKVAFDMTPTLGIRTGIGHVVHHLHESLEQHTDHKIQSYTLSLKAKQSKESLPHDNIFIPYPAKILLNAWKHSNRFTLNKQFSDVDLVHATNYLAPPTKKPLLITIHDLTMVKYPELVTPQIRSLADLIKKRLSTGAHVHVPVQAIKDDVIEYFGSHIENKDNIHIVPFSLIDLDHSQPSQAIKDLCDGEPYIVSIGALEPRKNHVRLIKAFEKVYAANPRVRLFLVGPEGPAKEKIDEAISQLSIKTQSKIVVTGKVSNADRTEILKKAYMLAYPSIYEGFGLPLLEAMETQTPIVTTKEGSLSEVADDAAVFVSPYDIEDIAKGIIELLDNQDLRDKLIDNGSRRVKDFSWKKTALQTAQMYENIIEQN